MAACQRGEWAVISTILHGLRGAAGRFDDGAFARTALQAEDAIRAGHHTKLPALLAEAGQHYRTVLAQIESWLVDLNPATQPDALHPPCTASKQDLEYLLRLLEEQAFIALEEFDRLQPALAAAAPADTRIITDLLDRLDFQQAAEHLRLILSEMSDASEHRHKARSP